ncbi:YfiR family protein [Phenylobacterium sp. LjRoot225]|uniref:YfiR family protein n=1 Tax=Phenylobacterium sp. LjRoot225 TaxID=3342285 RepID=UPI003ED14101
MLALAIWTSSSRTSRAQDASLEYAVKANFLFKFGPFVEWPPRVFASATAPFNICVVGQDPFGPALDDAVRSQTIDGHPIAVRRLRTVSAEPPCHVLYVGRSPDQKPSDILRIVRGAPVLTVTDEGVGTGGGIVHFVLRQGRVRFGVNSGSAQTSGLTISSKLLGLAVPVRTAGG